MPDLTGKVAVVTGTAHGIGAGIAAALEASGARVHGCDRDTVDVSDARQVADFIGGIGRVDILVNNAAITFIGDLDIPLKRHDLVMEVNLRAPLIACRTAVPGMQKRGEGAIVNVSSNAALYPHPGVMSYGISKIGLERLTVDLAKQLQPWSIAVNCFRIDVAVASEGFVANTPGVDRSTWEPCEVAAEGIMWMLSQPPTYSGRLESMYALRHREGIMASRAEVQREGPPPVTELFSGLAPLTETTFREPYPPGPEGEAR